jgi:hypothetical protein
MCPSLTLREAVQEAGGLPWQWGTVRFACFEGGMTSYPARVPVIIKIDRESW